MRGRFRLLLAFAIASGCAGSDDPVRDGGHDGDVAGDVAGDGPCAPGLLFCAGACTDPATDPANCGSCARRCDADEVCNEGTCASTCSGGLHRCSGSCVDWLADEAHCGSCERTCLAFEECRAGTCSCDPSCAGRPCGPDGCGGTCAPGCGPGYACTAEGTCSCGGTACGTVCCAAGVVCSAGACCTPSCWGRECGSDGCGGTCPPGCGADRTCTGSGTCACAGTSCGGDCCSSGEVCWAGACCTSSCAGRECGSDGCGGTCPPGCDTAYACTPSGTCAFDRLVFEAEAPGMGHDTGRAEADGWSAATGPDSRAYMLFGPYTRDVPAGARSAAFSMMVDNNTADDLRVVRLDVFDAVAARELASREVRRREFAAAWAYQDFAVWFAASSAQSLEFRVYWDDISYVRVDRVTVR